MNFRERVYELMNADEKRFFHSFKGDDFLSQSIREILENYAHEFNGKLFYYSLNETSIRLTYQFADSYENYLFRNELIKLGINYSSTGWPETTHIVLDFEIPK